MDIDGSWLSGVIPRQNPEGFGVTVLHFYLIAYNAEGNQIWIDELPYTCDPYTHGDPYGVEIVVPAPFTGTWKKLDHQPGHDPLLTIIRMAPDAIVRYKVSKRGDRETLRLMGWSMLGSGGNPKYEFDSDNGFLYDLVTGDTYRKVSGSGG
jgi:hypothetical protein